MSDINLDEIFGGVEFTAKMHSTKEIKEYKTFTLGHRSKYFNGLKQPFNMHHFYQTTLDILNEISIDPEFIEKMTDLDAYVFVLSAYKHCIADTINDNGSTIEISFALDLIDQLEEIKTQEIEINPEVKIVIGQPNFVRMVQLVNYFYQQYIINKDENELTNIITGCLFICSFVEKIQKIIISGNEIEFNVETYWKFVENLPAKGYARIASSLGEYSKDVQKYRIISLGCKLFA